MTTLNVSRSTQLTNEDRFGIEVRTFLFLLRQRDSRHALYLALSIEEDSKPGTPRSQIRKRHAPSVADHLLFEALGHFFQGSELLAFVISMENEAMVKWKFDTRLGRRTLGKSVAPSPVVRDLECLVHGHSAPDAETGPTRVHAGVLR